MGESGADLGSSEYTGDIFTSGISSVNLLDSSIISFSVSGVDILFGVICTLLNTTGDAGSSGNTEGDPDTSNIILLDGSLVIGSLTGTFCSKLRGCAFLLVIKRLKQSENILL